jgi:hypothetical protein
MDSERISKMVLEFYLNSGDFKGTPLDRVLELGGLESNPSDTVRELVKKGVLEVVSEKWQGNPHIKRLWPSSVNHQLECLDSAVSNVAPQDASVIQIGNFTVKLALDTKGVCLYPSPAYLQQKVQPNDDLDRPFTRRLRLGDPQLKPLFFDLAVLERYHADPRYRFSFSDYKGSICVTDEHDQSTEMPDRDKVFLQSFGIGRDSNNNRVVAVFLRYLADLTSEHQKYWETHVHNGECKLEEDYYRNSILGEWAEGISIYSAFLEELLHINQMLQRMECPPLFRDSFQSNRPEEFGLFMRPTLRNFYNFAHVLDKMLSDNLNYSFFQQCGLQLEKESPRNDGRVKVERKGTLALLDEWLRSAFPTEDAKEFYQILAPLKEVRNLRMKPAHTLQQNEFDQMWHRRQDELIEAVYGAVRSIRVVISKHPKLRGYEIPTWLTADRIKVY